MNTTKPPAFDKIECYRCTGSGRLTEYANVHGGVCFLCNGTGGRLTPAGKAAKTIFDKIISERIVHLASTVKAGDVVRENLPTARWRTVTETGVNEQGHPFYVAGGTRYLYREDTLLRFRPTADDIAAGVAAISRRKGWTPRSLIQIPRRVA